MPDKGTDQDNAEINALDAATANEDQTGARVLSPAAQRALAEAAERRRLSVEETPPPETGGRGGKDPARFGDWEIKGRAIDF